MDNQIATSSTNTFCRLCLSGDTLNHVNIFKNKLEFQDVLFTTIIKDCLNIESALHDGLPNIICKDCQRQLAQFHDFKVKCREVYDRLLLKREQEIGEDSDVQMLSVADDRTQQDNSISMNISELSSNGTSSSSPVDGERAMAKDPNVINCKYCCKIFRNKKEILNHINRQHGSKNSENRCFYCDEEFHTSTHYKRHLKLQESFETTLSYFKFRICHICRVVFKVRQEFLKHNDQKHPEIVIVEASEEEDDTHIDSTEASLRNKALTLQNTTINVSDEPYRCDECAVTHFEVDDMKYHILTHLPKYVCPIKNCEMEYTSIMHFRKHLAENSHKTNQCPKCKEVFSEAEELIQHKTTNCASNKVHCTHCDKYFISDSALAHHLRTANKNAFLCDICKRTFPRRRDLAEHYRTHSNAKPYKCKTCNKLFKSFLPYFHHLDFHKTERSYVCNICDRKFQTLQTYRAHIHHHKGRKYTCDICSIHFANQTQLMVHDGRQHR